MIVAQRYHLERRATCDERQVSRFPSALPFTSRQSLIASVTEKWLKLASLDATSCRQFKRTALQEPTTEKTSRQSLIASRFLCQKRKGDEASGVSAVGFGSDGNGRGDGDGEKGVGRNESERTV
jgi:hypothetical protein